MYNRQNNDNIMKKITPFFWFDRQAEEASEFYTSLFENSKTGQVTRYTDEGKDVHGMSAGTVMTIGFTLAGQPFAALNGGPRFTFNPAISFFVICETENEIERLWNDLGKNGQIMMPLDKYDWSEKYGWIQDRFGISWQVEPEALPEMLMDKDPEKVKRVTSALLKMKKLDVSKLQAAFHGKSEHVKANNPLKQEI
jgi:predicted 3-demethylubiquinone-9 3-methyltransferase (glyoxalase superfamily)